METRGTGHLALQSIPLPRAWSSSLSTPSAPAPTCPPTICLPPPPSRRRYPGATEAAPAPRKLLGAASSSASARSGPLAEEEAMATGEPMRPIDRGDDWLNRRDLTHGFHLGKHLVPFSINERHYLSGNRCCSTNCLAFRIGLIQRWHFGWLLIWKLAICGIMNSVSWVDFGTQQWLKPPLLFPN